MSAATIESLARRAAAGEVNARDELARIGHGDVPGYGMLQRVRAGLSRFGAALDPFLSFESEWGSHPEDGKPELPKGALSGLGNIKTFVPTVLGCRKYRDGAWACAIVIASGPPLDAAQVQKMAGALGMSATQAKCFSHAVKFPHDHRGLSELAAKVDPSCRTAVAVGQCVGRARLLQAARSTSQMGGVDRVIGWELGET